MCTQCQWLGILPSVPDARRAAHPLTKDTPGKAVAWLQALQCRDLMGVSSLDTLGCTASDDNVCALFARLPVDHALAETTQAAATRQRLLLRQMACQTSLAKLLERCLPKRRHCLHCRLLQARLDIQPRRWPETRSDLWPCCAGAVPFVGGGHCLPTPVLHTAQGCPNARVCASASSLTRLNLPIARAFTPRRGGRESSVRSLAGPNSVCS